MAEEVSIPAGEKYILVRSEGAPSLNEMRQTLSSISELSKHHKIKRVLVDGRARTEQPAISDIYSGGELLANILGNDFFISVLVNEIENSHKFFENVAVNRGANVAYFIDEDKALTWLLEETE